MTQTGLALPAARSKTENVAFRMEATAKQLRAFELSIISAMTIELCARDAET